MTAPRAPLLLCLLLADGAAAETPEPRLEAVREGLLSPGRGTREDAEAAARDFARTDPMGLMDLWDGLDLQGRCLLLRALGAAGTRHAAEVALSQAAAPEQELFRALLDGLVTGGETSLFAPLPDGLPPPRAAAIEDMRLRYRVEAEFVRLKSPTGLTGHYTGQFQRVKTLGPVVIPILLDIVADRARPLPGESAAGPYAPIHPGMIVIDPQELRGMAAYAFGEIVEKTDLATIRELLRLHDEYTRLHPEEYRFECEDLAPSIAYSLFDIGVPGPALRYIGSLIERYQDGDNGYQVLWDLGYACIRVKRYEEGEYYYAQVLRYSPTKGIAAYNLACNFSMRAQDAAAPWRDRFKREALDYLRMAIEDYGYGDWKWMEEDGDLDFIRGEREYKALLRRLKERYPERAKGKVAKGRSALGGPK